MCLLTYLSPGTLPVVSHLVNGAITNNDGHGYAIVTADCRLIVHRGMNAGDVIDAFVADRERHPEGPAMFHSRFATHGVEDLSNVHPFPVSGDLRTVVAHNGILPASMQPGKGEPRSDTALLAARMGQRFGSLAHKRVREDVERFMGTGNKLVVLTVSRKHAASAYILNERAGEWVGGTWYSNDGWKPYTSRYAYAYGSGAWTATDTDGTYVESNRAPWDEELERCELCYAIVSSGDHYMGRCSACLSCLDCLEHVRDCQCWTPTKARKTAQQAIAEAEASNGVVMGPRALTSRPMALAD